MIHFDNTLNALRSLPRKCTFLVRIEPVWEETNDQLDVKHNASTTPTYGLFGLVLQDLIDLVHDLGGQLGQDLESLTVVGSARTKRVS
jgi:hypothetical protein